MKLVSFALRRPISLLMAVVATSSVGFLAIDRMARDIFPDLGVPVLYVAQPYGGLDPAQMEGFIVNYYEYHFLFITGIEHVESKSIQGVGSSSSNSIPARTWHRRWRRLSPMSIAPAPSCRREPCRLS
jgi:multidrug efflux pump subunit AcrB